MDFEEDYGVITKRLRAAFALFLFVSLSYLTYQQISIWKDAVTLWTYVVQKERSFEAYYNLGIAFFDRRLAHDEKGEFDEAIEDLHKAIDLHSCDLAAYALLGVVYSKAGRLDKAVASLDKAIALGPIYPVIYRNRGYAYYLKGRYDPALVDLSTAIEMEPGYDMAYLDRGNTFLKIGKMELAFRDFQRACDFGE